MTVYVFPCNPLNGRGYDPEFVREVNAFKWSDDHTMSVDHDALRSGDVILRTNSEVAGEQSVYRGWMMTVDEYTLFHAVIVSKGLNPVTNPEQYETAHHIDGWVAAFDGLTFKTVLLPVNPSISEVDSAIEVLGSNKFFVKDYVKSLKHDPSLSVAIADELYETIIRFCDEQGDWLTGGIAVREFVELPEDRVEIRGWWREGVWKTFTTHPDYSDKDFVFNIPTEFLDEVSSRLTELNLAFVTVDFTPTSDGWKVIEVGDAQVSGLPAHISEDVITTILK